MITFSRITSPADRYFDRAMQLYSTSFPPHEQRLTASQLEILSNPLYHCDVILHEQAFCGLIFSWEINGICYIEHFAVSDDMRGKGIGSAALRMVLQAHPTTVLEIDPPVDSISRRRENFYTAVGMQGNPFRHFHPPYRPHTPAHELKVLSYPQPLSEEQYRSFAEFLSNKVMRNVF